MLTKTLSGIDVKLLWIIILKRKWLFRTIVPAFYSNSTVYIQLFYRKRIHFEAANYICQTCLAIPVKSLGESYYLSQLSSQISLSLNGMHGSDDISVSKWPVRAAGRFWLLQSALELCTTTTGLKRGDFFWGEGEAVRTQSAIKPCRRPLLDIKSDTKT